ncbi:MAG: 2-oxoacid:acceptor oxidoreductase subunit alpha [Anaerolineales bacterium]|nr:2-oxoacid:acceptor oxidoreductase subunit alpha [Anaerolineales bacterium]
MTDKIVNDFSIIVGTVNGSGSQTANTTVLRALFRMGIPVSGKNLFPSNIQGLPTWYTIRVNENGFVGRSDKHEIVIAMNPASFVKDLADTSSGGAFFYSDDIKFDIKRDDIAAYPMPVKEIIKSHDIPSNLRTMVSNMVYVGVLAQMIGIKFEKIVEALEFHFKGKQKPIDLNTSVVKSSMDWAKDNLEKKDPFRAETSNKTEGLIMTDGNTAAALGSIYGGVQFAAWYPITPATSLAEALHDYLPILRKTKDGKNTFAVVQAEDELSAIGMTIGAGWSGLRAMTSTSGPGLSLMTEFAGFAYYAEIPIVVWDVQRVGPSTGLPTRTSQGDISFVNYLGHGDTHQVILIPGSVNECFEFGWKAFDIAEHLQAPVFVLSDLDFGMNQWMTEPFEYPDQPMDRGKLLWEADLDKIKNRWGRYLDIDGDGIPYRTVPGNRHPNSAYFLRGTGHDDYGNYTEDAADWVKLMARLVKKYETAREIVPKPVIESTKGAEVGIIAYGSTGPAIEETRHVVAREAGIKTDFLRLRSIPFTDTIKDFIRDHKTTYVVEMNRDGQVHQLLTLEYPEFSTKLISIARLDGLPAAASWIIGPIIDKETKK